MTKAFRWLRFRPRVETLETRALPGQFLPAVAVENLSADRTAWKIEMPSSDDVADIALTPTPAPAARFYFDGTETSHRSEDLHFDKLDSQATIALIRELASSPSVQAPFSWTATDAFFAAVSQSTVTGDTPQPKVLDAKGKAMPPPTIRVVKPNPAPPKPNKSQSDAPVSASPQVNELLRLHNQDRAWGGLSPLRLNSRLMASAQGFADYLERTGQFSHDADGRSPGQRITAQGYHPLAWGENIARGFYSPASVTGAWMNSPGHRANIMNGKYRDVGFGISGSYWVADFGAT